MLERVGPYQITREIGRGGMGVVYLARDDRLDRDVAIKALPPEFAADPARLDRFEREARTLASLNHANLAGIHGIEEQDGARYLVLEYVDGETLADRLDRGALPPDEAAEFAAQIAAGVEAAHEAGVVHRDLKPANIKITPEGRIKVLDFGLARSDEGTVSATGALDSPTLTRPQPQHSPTIEGAILGTAAYMSPEQARGRRVDKRTDIWSFGVVVYEMLTGVGPFHGETATDSIGAILHKDIDLSRLPPDTPPMVRHIIRRCLERDRNQRLQSIGDARVELQDTHQHTGQHTGPHAEPNTQQRGPGWLWPALAACLAAALVAAIIAGPRLLVEHPAPRAAIAGVSQITDLSDVVSDPALSPDGRAIAYAAESGGDLDIHRLRVGGANPNNLTADSDADDFDPAFSPDGQRIAFASTREGGGIFVMGATGENPRRISDNGFDPAWSPDGASIVYTTQRVINPYGRTGLGTLRIVDLESGIDRALEITTDSDAAGDPAAASDASENDAVEPAWSPDGTHIAYWGITGGQRDLYTVPAAGGARTPLTSDIHTDWNPLWSPDSRTIYFISDRAGEAGLWSIPLNEQAGPAGPPEAIMPGPVSVIEAAIGSDGSSIAIVVDSVRATIERRPFDRETERFTGRTETLIESSRYIITPDVDHDQTWITYRSAAPEEDIIIVRTDGTGKRRLTEGLYKDRGSIWSPDGRRITFYSNRNGLYEIWQMNRDGTDAAPVLSDPNTSYTTPIASPDGRILVVSRITSGPPTTAVFDSTDDGYTLRTDMVHGFTNAMSWSLDGSRLLGFSPNAMGTLVPSLWMPATNEVTILGEDIAGLDQYTIRSIPGWIDGHRLLWWDEPTHTCSIFDTETNERRPIDSGPAAGFSVIGYRGGDTLYTVSNTTSNDIWMLELALPSDDDR